MNRKPTMRDVAIKAQISIASISRTFSQPHLVTQKTRIKVIKAAKRLGYFYKKIHDEKETPSQTKHILVFYRDHEHNEQIFMGLDEQAKSERYRLIYIRLPFPYDTYWITNLLRVLLIYIDGIILVSCVELLALIQSHLLSEHFPIVVVNNFALGNTFIDLDHIAIAFEATNHLITRGHRHIAYLLNKTNKKENNALQQGYFQALQRNNLPVSKEYIIECKNTFDAGTTSFKQLSRLTFPPTAICCYNTLFTHSILAQTKKSHYIIPENLSLLCLTNSVYNHIHEFPITSIDKPLKEMGRKAIKLLIKQHLEKINNRESIILDCKLVVRSSTC